MSILNENQIEKLLPILEDIIAILKKRDKITEKQINLFLENLDLSKEVYFKEAEKWAELLLKYKNAEDEDEKDAIEIIALKRGIPKASLTISFSELKNNIFVEESGDLRISRPQKNLFVSVNVLNFGQIEIGEKKRISFFVEGGPGSIENGIQYLKLSKTTFGVDKEGIKAIMFGGNEGEQIADSIYFRTNNEVKEVTVIADWKEKKSEKKVSSVFRNAISIEDNTNNVNTIESNDAEKCFNLGKLFLEQKNYDKAIENFQQAISLEPNNSAYITYLGLTYHSQKKYGLAIEQYKKAIEIDPKYAWAYNLLGYFYKTQGKYDLAIVQYLKAISLEPKNTEYIYNLGYAYKIQEKYDLAIEQFRKAVSLEPDNSAYTASLAFTIEQNKRSKINSVSNKSIRPKKGFWRNFFE